MASQFLTLVGELAGEARCQPEPCTERYWSKLSHHLGCRAVLPLERRITESALSLGGGRGVWDLGARAKVGRSCACTPSRSSIFWGGASAPVHRQSGQCKRWRASCAFLCCEQRQVPTVSCLLAWVSRWCSTLIRSSMCLGTRFGCSVESCGKFPIFPTCCSRCSPGIRTLFPELLVSGSHLPLCVATVHGCSWTNFVFFLREKWTRISLQFTLGNLELFLRAVSGSLRVRQSTVLLEEFHIFSTCWLSRFPAQFALENLDIISTCSHMAVGGFLTHFSRSSRSSGEFFAIEGSCTIYVC